MTPCKPITNKSNQFSYFSWPFNPEADWPNRRLTDWLNDCSFHSSTDYPFCGDCLILWWIHFRLRLVMVISDGCWMAVCLFSDLIPAFSFTTVIVLDFLNLKISQFTECRCWFFDWDNFAGLCDCSNAAMILVISGFLYTQWF